eukprot:CAMPEP_0206138822 /NCGR_PEP_ID=MMETSP1473-20131121/3713_1 /ASSEMBLY_ACC=CAM_ASM_001109 /TAXON_ID=1461547 /ORGANISM="Stichococcus sp, Strain RCC1054" /LENGTH=434 /DNA_ID=CAMNT_0053532349 /DNA_START=198 /DNA_END=1502 /DNA_ORIENTATION=+
MAAASSYKYVVLGGGNAAGYFAKEAVAQGVQKGDLAIVSEEPVVSYERPALSKAYLNPEGAPRLPGFHTCVGGGGDKQTPEWYEEKGIDFKTGTVVKEVDVVGKKLVTDGGDTIEFQKLVLATGCGVIDLHKDFKTEGADLDNILTLRDVRDADKIVAAMADCKQAGGKVVVVGGGYIGMEVASGLEKNGLDVTMVFPDPFFMPRLFTPEIAGFYEEYYANKGIKVIKGKSAKSFKGQNGKVATTVLDDGTELESPLVVVGVGSKPRTELFKGQVDLLDDRPGGVKVNSQLQTSNPDVYAIGDIALYPQPQYNNETTRMEHVQHARESGTFAAKEVLGKGDGSPYTYTPYFYSRVYDLGWEFYGSQKGDTVFFGDKGAKKFGSYWVDGGKVVGGFIEGGSDEEKKALKKLANSPASSPGEEELKKQGISFALSL